MIGRQGSRLAYDRQASRRNNASIDFSDSRRVDARGWLMPYGPPFQLTEHRGLVPARVLDGQRRADLWKATRVLLEEPVLTKFHRPYANEFRPVRRHIAKLWDSLERSIGA